MTREVNQNNLNHDFDPFSCPKTGMEKKTVKFDSNHI